MGIFSSSVFSGIKSKNKTEVSLNYKTQNVNVDSTQTYDIIDYAEKVIDFYDKIYDTEKMLALSFGFGVLEVVENVADGLILAGGALTAWGAGILGNEEASQNIKEGTQKAIAYDWTAAGYDVAVDLLNIDEDIAYGTAHNIATGAGTAAGYVALSMVPGGALVTGATGALSAAGSAAERAANSGATYEQMLTVGIVSGVAGAISGGALNKLQGLASSAKTIGSVIGYTLAGSATAAAEPLINITTEYLTYGKNTSESWGSYFKESGGLINVGMAAIIGGTSTGLKAVQGYKIIKIKKEYVAKLVAEGVIDEKVAQMYVDGKIKKIYLGADEIGTSKGKAHSQIREMMLKESEKRVIDEADYQLTLNQMDSAAEYYNKKGILTEKKFWDILETPHDERINLHPEDYLEEGYVKKLQSALLEPDADGVAKASTIKHFNNYEHHINKKFVGNDGDYDVFVSPTKQTQSMIKKAKDISTKKVDAEKLVKSAALNPNEIKSYEQGTYRYDIKVTPADVGTSSSLFRLPTGAEKYANSKWIPGGLTLGSFDGVGNKIGNGVIEFVTTKTKIISENKDINIGIVATKII